MFATISGRKIFFDVDGEKFSPAGPEMQEKPTLIVIHGAPGMSDHTAMKPAFKTLRDDMQIIYLDLAGADRSNGVSRCLKALAPLGR